MLWSVSSSMRWVANALFEREHHRRVASILESLDAAFLQSHGCYFGGGTAIVLGRGEYRDSLDIDFLVSDVTGYRALRGRFAHLRDLVRAGAVAHQSREVRADQYGMRTLVMVHDVQIKFEIVLEGRVMFEKPSSGDEICGVATLTQLDMATSKLLANSDRWADDSVHSRDLIDLAMLKLDRATLSRAIAKASGAYGESIERDLVKAIEALKRRRGRLEECMRALQMLDVPSGLTPVVPAVLWKQIRQLAPKAQRLAKKR